MSAVELPKMPAIKVGQVYLRGKCIQTRKGGEYWVHLVVLPAPDAYSSPSTVEILAKHKIADREDDYAGVCEVRGFRRSYNKRDPEDGRDYRVQTADNKLFAVEG